MTTVWITGAAGFIGGHLARYAAAQGARVIGIGHGLPPSGTYFDRPHGWLNGDVSEANLRHLAGNDGPPDVIFHLAGGSSVGASLAAPLEDFQRTVVASAHLFDWVRSLATRPVVVCASSAAVYGSGHDGPVVENAPLRPFSPYGFHKRMMELEAEAQADAFRLRAVVVRLFSIYGPGLRKQLLWDIGQRLASGVSQLELGGTGDELRDWLYVEDAVRLLWLAGCRSERGPSTVNGCTGVGVSVNAIARAFCEAWGADVTLSFTGRARPGDPKLLVGDPRRAIELGFTPEMTLAAGLTRTVAWVKRQLSV